MLYYVAIFLAKILEVALMTVRTVLLTRGERLYGSIIGFAEVIIWLYVVSVVLVGIKDDPIRMVVYAVGFAFGNYLGSILEEKLALGILTINVIATKENGEKIAAIVRKQNIGVTGIAAEGINEIKKMLIIHVKRKRRGEVIKLIEGSNINCVISINDTRTVYGGYGMRK
jgi:uncharacterized protein YebE (UPF0316 family)